MVLAGTGLPAPMLLYVRITLTDPVTGGPALR